MSSTRDFPVAESMLPKPGPFLLVTGLPGAGKSTTCHELATRYPLSIHLDGDLLQGMIVGGNRVWNGPWTTESLAQGRLCAAALIMLGVLYHDAGYAVFVDTVITSRAQVRDLLSLSPYMDIAVLDVSPEEAKRREGSRTKASSGDWQHLYNEMCDELRGHDQVVWIDAMSRRSSEIADAIQHQFEG